MHGEVFFYAILLNLFPISKTNRNFVNATKEKHFVHNVSLVARFFIMVA